MHARTIKTGEQNRTPRAYEQYPNVGALLRQRRPKEPVYCIFPHVYRDSTRAFLQGFPGRVLYAVKANPEPQVLDLLVEAGVRHFDCASLPEIELMQRVYDAIEDIALNDLGLDVYPNQIEIISSEQMLDAYASVGMPLMYHH